MSDPTAESIRTMTEMVREHGPDNLDPSHRLVWEAAHAEGVRDGMEAAARIVDEEADEWSTVVGGSAQSCQTACDLAAAAIRDSVEDDRG